MTIKVLGACCKRSQTTFENVKKAVEELGLGIEVENVGDMAIIARYGVMSTPALVIDEKVVASGRLLETKEAVRLIESIKK